LIRGLGRELFHVSWTVLLAGYLVFCTPVAAADDLTNQEIEGRAIFLTGQTDEPETYAAVGVGNVQVPLTAVPCGSCHGRDGRGGAERGWPPNITWPALISPDTTSGRKRPAYSDMSLTRAITMGIDAGGNRLDPTMPRFHLSMTDAAALLGYIKRLSTLPEPGVDDHSLVFGTVLAAHDQAAALALSAYLAKVNQDGGLFGRQIGLSVKRLAPGEPPGHSIAQLASSEGIFAILAPDIGGDETSAVTAADADGVPIIGPATQSTQTAPRSRYVFYLNGGVEAEARALAGFAATLPGLPSIADDRTPVWHAAALAAVTRLATDGRPPEPLSPDDPRLFAGNGPVLWFAESTPNYGELLERRGTQPTMLSSGTLADEMPPHDVPASTWLAYTAGPPDITPDAMAEYRELAARYDLPPDDQLAQREALAAAKIAIEALRRAGRNVTRERLVDVMEGLQDFHTGLIPPVSYSATRRIGTDGIWIVPLGGGSPIWWDR
jgi:ABC-type branched-subunit amino acid transport system substrate-binding protein/mono/diheme cytochrome c family protein